MAAPTLATVAQNDTFDTWRLTLNTVTARFNTLGDSGEIVITGGSIEGTPLGEVDPSTGKFTNLTLSSTLDATGATLIFDDDSISGDKIDGGEFAVDDVSLNNAPTANDHATKKLYVDTAIEDLRDDMIFMAITFGE